MKKEIKKLIALVMAVSVLLTAVPVLAAEPEAIYAENQECQRMLWSTDKETEE